MANNAYKAYQQNSVLTASPGELTLMLYEGCIKFIKQGRLAIQEQNFAEKNDKLIRAQLILTELMVTLDEKQPISKEMMTMYDYMHRRLIEANMKNKLEILDEVELLVSDFRDTWKQVMELNRKSQSNSTTVRTHA